MFALLALAGDLGCTAGPTLVGMVSDSFGGELKTGILVAVIFPALMIVACIVCALMEKKRAAALPPIADGGAEM